MPKPRQMIEYVDMDLAMYISKSVCGQREMLHMLHCAKWAVWPTHQENYYQLAAIANACLDNTLFKIKERDCIFRVSSIPMSDLGSYLKGLNCDMKLTCTLKKYLLQYPRWFKVSSQGKSLRVGLRADNLLKDAQGTPVAWMSMSMAFVQRYPLELSTEQNSPPPDHIRCRHQTDASPAANAPLVLYSSQKYTDILHGKKPTSVKFGQPRPFTHHGFGPHAQQPDVHDSVSTKTHDPPYAFKASTPGHDLFEAAPAAEHLPSAGIWPAAGGLQSAAPLQDSVIGVTTGAEADMAVNVIQKHRVVAVQCQGSRLGRDGRLCIVQVAVQSEGGATTCYIFDLVAASTSERPHLVAAMRSFLEATAVQKVMHDCRRAAESLFYQLGIRPANVLDTQVIFGLGQVASNACGMLSQRYTHRRVLAHLLATYKLPVPSHTITKGYQKATIDIVDVWERRPLMRELLQFTVAEISGLLPLARLLQDDVKLAAGRALVSLSAAHSEWFLDDAQRSHASRHSTAVLSNRDHFMTFDANCKPSFQPCPHAEDGHPPEPAPSLDTCMDPPHSKDDSSPSSEAAAAQGLRNAAAPAAEGVDDREEGEVSGVADGWAIADADAVGQKRMRGRGDGERDDRCGAAQSGHWSDRGATADCEQGYHQSCDLDVDLLLAAMPRTIANAVRSQLWGCLAPFISSISGGHDSGRKRAKKRQRLLIELVADQGRETLLRWSDGSEEALQGCGELDLTEATHCLSEFQGQASSSNTLHHGRPSQESGDPFQMDNRAGISGTLHRISAIRGQSGDVIGLTYRIGRHIAGVGNLVLDLLARMAAGQSDRTQEDYGPPSLLLLGPPGAGKTTLLRDIAHLLAERFAKRVVVVDSSCEVAGGGVVPHPCIGRARRIPVRDRRQQHDTLIEAVQNHNPEVILVDELGTAAEVAAVRSIAQRGVAMVATAHGIRLQGLMANPELNALLGGFKQVTISDALARESGTSSKIRTERAGTPAFSMIVEVLSYDEWRIHSSTARAVDAILAGGRPATQLRRFNSDGQMVCRFSPASGPQCYGPLEGGMKDAGSKATIAPWLQDLYQVAAR